MLSQDLTNIALTLPPNAPALHDENGKLSWKDWNASLENPLAYLKRTYEATSSNLMGNSVIRYSILPNLEIRTNLGYTNIGGDAIAIIPASSLSPDTFTKINSSNFSRSSFQNWIIEPQLNWKPKLGSGLFDILAGTTFMDQKNEGLAQSAEGFSSEALMKNIAAAPTIFSGTNYYSQYRYYAVFGRVNYSLKERYIINATGRRDGSSRFGPGKQFALFSAIGTAWVFSKTEFVKAVLPFLSFGKIRGSYGTTGNDQIGDYQFLDTYRSSGTYQGKIGLTPVRLNNPEFGWETNKKIEGGIDLAFVNDRISLGVSYYSNLSSSQLVGLPLAPTTGFGSIQGNFPATVQNKGLELILNTRNIEATNFSWSTSFNISIPSNKLVEFPNIGSFPSYVNMFVVGSPLTIGKQYHYNGVDPSTGVYLFEDVNGDGSYTVGDRQRVKFIGRNFYGGLQNSFHYKGFQLAILFQYVKQQGYDYMRAFLQAPGTQSNQPDLVMDRWRQSGDNTGIQRFAASGSSLSAYSRLRTSDLAINDASFIRLKNVSFSYSLSNKLIQKLHLLNANIFMQGQNLMTMTKYKGLDPEAAVSTGLPPLRTLTFGIHLTF